MHQGLHRDLARIVGAAAAQQVVQDALAQRALADLHALQAQRGEHRLKHQHATGDDRASVARQAGQVDVLDAVGLQQALAHQRQRLGRDRTLGQLECGADLADRLVGARRTHRLVPAQAAVCRGELLELGGDLGQRRVPFLLRQASVGEEPARAGDAAGLQAFALQRLHAAADDAFGGTAADVDDQPQLVVLGRLRVGHAEIDQARFLAAGDHFDRMPQRGLRRDQEAGGRTQLADGVRGHRAHMGRRDVGDALAEARQAVDGARLRLRGHAAEPVQALGHAHGFAQPVDHPQLAQYPLRHHHVETVRAQVQRGQHVAVARRGRAVGRGAALGRPHAMGRPRCVIRALSPHRPARHHAYRPSSSDNCAENGSSPAAGMHLA
jgi:hypothetical protein